MARLSLRTTRWREALVVTAVGQLTSENTGELRAALGRRQSGVRRLVLDLRSLAAIDAAGLEAIAEAHAEICLDGRELVVVRPHPRVASWQATGGEDEGPPVVENIVEAIARPGATSPARSTVA